MYTIISITLKKCMPCMPKTEKIKEYRILDTFLKQQKTNKKTTLVMFYDQNIKVSCHFSLN